MALIQDLLADLYSKYDNTLTTAADLLFNSILSTSLDITRLIKVMDTAMHNVSTVERKVDQDHAALLYYLTA